MDQAEVGFTDQDTSETLLMDRVLLCFPAGEAQAVLAKAEAKSKAIRMLSDALTEQVKRSLSFSMRSIRPLSYL